MFHLYVCVISLLKATSFLILTSFILWQVGVSSSKGERNRVAFWCGLGPPLPALKFPPGLFSWWMLQLACLLPRL